jgi:hypothetical protein
MIPVTKVLALGEIGMPASMLGHDHVRATANSSCDQPPSSQQGIGHQNIPGLKQAQQIAQQALFAATLARARGDGIPHHRTTGQAN